MIFDGTVPSQCYRNRYQKNIAGLTYVCHPVCNQPQPQFARTPYKVQLVFLNAANFTKQNFLNLAPPSRYALNLKALIKLSKVSWTSQLSFEILRSLFERKFDKTNFISLKRTPPKRPHHLGLRTVFILCKCVLSFFEQLPCPYVYR